MEEGGRGVLRNVSASSLTLFCSGALGTIRADGIIKNTNTLEEFKNLDKPAMIQTAGRQVGRPHNDNRNKSNPLALVRSSKC